MALLIWGTKRGLPVQVSSVAIAEQAFDTNLNPTRAKTDLSMKVITYRDLDATSAAYWVYMAAFTPKEVLATMNTIGNNQSIRQVLPFRTGSGGGASMFFRGSRYEGGPAAERATERTGPRPN